MKFPYTVTTDNITIFVGGQIIKMPSTHSGFKAMVAHLQGAAHDEEIIRQLSDKVKALSRLTAGKVTVIENTVYYRGAPVRSALSDRLVKLTDEGYDATPWALFMDKVMQNPSENSKERLFQFLERWDAPLTPDGDFIAFKGVNDDYSSTRNDPQGNRVYNRPGDTVEMPRELVEEDPDVTCASGLHACASHYLDSFWNLKKIVALAINPKDVVSIPSDYNLSKMRVCRYHVLGDVEDPRHRDDIEKSQVIDKDADGRVVRIAAEPVVVKAPKEGILTYNGETFVKTDNDFEEGDYAVHNKTGKIGKVEDYYEVNFDDEEHPRYKEWKEGQTAGDDIKCVMYICMKLHNGAHIEGSFDPENSDCSVQDFTPVAPFWDEVDDCGFEDHDSDDDEIENDDFEEDYSAVMGYDDDAEDLEEGGYINGVWTSYRDMIGDKTEEPTFEHEATGRSFTTSQFLFEVRESGQRAFSRKYGVPRTTVQDWLRRATQE